MLCSTFTQYGETKTFSKELPKVNKQPYDSDYGQRVQHSSYFASKKISCTKLSFISDEKDSSGLGSSVY